MVDDLRTNAIANLAVGDIGLLAAAIRVDHPGRAIVLFALVNIAIAVSWGRLGPGGRLRREAPLASVPPGGRALEELSVTRRRVCVALIPAVVVLAVLVGLAPETAAVVAGVPAGVGAGELWLLGWARKFQDDHREELFREAPSSPFSAGRREVYTLPMNEVTDAT